METNKANEIKKEINSKKPSNWKSYFWKVPILLVVIFLFLSIIATLFVTFNFSKTYLLKVALNFANDEFNGKFNFEKVYFNPFKGIFLENLTMTLDNDTIAFVPKVRVDWDFLPIFERKIIVQVVEIKEPRFNLVKEHGDSLWNIDKFFKPSKRKATQSKTNLIVFLNNVKIEKGVVRVQNYNNSNFQMHFNPENLFAENLDFKMKGKLNLYLNKYDINIEHVSFVDKISKFRLKKLSASVTIDTNNIHSDFVELETEQSKIRTSLDYDLSENKIAFGIDKSSVNTSDLLKFAEIPFSDNFNLNVSGGLVVGDSLIFKEFSFGFESGSKLKFEGTVTHLNESTNLNFKILDAKIIEKEVRELLPTIFVSIPVNFDYFSTRNFSFQYINNTIGLKGNFSSSLGMVDAELKIENNSNFYFDLSFNKLNLAKVVEEAPNTDLTGQAKGNFSIGELSKISGNFVCNIFEGKANVDGTKNFKLTFYSKFNKGLINVDTLELIALRKDTVTKSAGKIFFSGIFDISNLKYPTYSGLVKLHNLRLNEFFPNEKNFPENVSGSFEFKGKGFDVNTFSLDFLGKFEEFLFSDRALFPFSLSLQIDHTDTLNRSIIINSELIKGKIQGHYEISSLIKDLSKQFTTVVDGFENKLNAIFQQDTISNVESSTFAVGVRYPKTPFKFRKARFSADFQVKDFSILNILLNTDITFSGLIKINAEIEEDKSVLKLDTLFVRFLSYTNENNRISLSNLLSKASYKVGLIEEEPTLDYIEFSATTDNRIIFGDSYFDYIDLNLNYQKDSLFLETSVGFNSTLNARIKSIASFSDSLIQTRFDELSLAYQNIFQWNLIKPFIVTISSNSILINDLELFRENAEAIKITGSYAFSGQINLSGMITQIPLIDFQKLLPEENSLANIKSFNGSIEKLQFNIFNTIEHPQIVLKLLASELKIENVDVGNFDLNVHYSSKNLSGGLDITNRNFSPVNLKLTKIPLELNFKSMKFGVIKDEEFEAEVKCDKFNLSLLAPLLSSTVEQLQGAAKISSRISGFLPENLKFSGVLEILESGFILKTNNIKYFLNGKIELKGTEFYLRDLKVANTREDYRSGLGIISGKIVFANNRLENIDISMNSPGIKVLSQASSKSLPQLYGDLVISTSPGVLRFVVNKNETLLEGNVNLVYGKLFMPGTAGTESVQQSFVKYEISGAKSEDTSKQKNEYISEDKKTSNLKLDITLRIIQPIELTLDVTSIGQVYALISLENNLSSLRFYSDPSNNITMLTGNDLILREGSTLKFIRLFNTEGKINFPTGSIDNPGLNLVARYNGQSIYNDAVRNYTVIVYITGTREKPNLKFDYIIDGQVASDDSSKVAQDAIFLLAFGKTKGEIERGGLGSNFNFSEFSTSGSSALLSKLVSDALSGTGFISSADILLPPTASSLDRATLKMSGRFLGMTWNFGGTMADLLNNNELSVEVPIGTVLPFNFPNIILQLSRTSNLTQSIQRNQKDWEIKLKYGSTW